MLKYRGAEVEHEIGGIFNCVMRGSEEVPQYWKCAKIMALFKKGNDRLPDNYRPISITPILYRLFSRILLARIHKKLDDAQSKDQAGFRPEFCCVDHLFTVTAIAEKANEFRIPLWIATVDFQKAFESVEHAAIWRALLDQRVEPAYVTLFQRLYDGQTATVQTDRRSAPFRIEKRTKQGNPISPILYHAVVEHFMKKLKEQWKTNTYGYTIKEFAEGEFITNLRYADDILLIARRSPQINKMLADLHFEAEKVGLKLHPDKTKIQHNGIGYGVGVKKAKCGSIVVEVLPDGEQTSCLERVINLRGLHASEVHNRIAKAWAEFGVFNGQL